VLLDPGRRRAEIHYTAKLKRAKAAVQPDSLAAEFIAADDGLSEVGPARHAFTDEAGTGTEPVWGG
jgi:hypothetical protein